MKLFRIFLTILIGIFIFGCSTKQPVFKIDQYVWPKESANPKFKAVRVIANSEEFPGKASSKNRLLQELVGDINVKWVDYRAIRIATDGRGKVYIAAPIAFKIQIIDFIQKEIRDIRFGSIMPCAIDVTKDGRIFIGNRSGGNVMEITEDKKVLWSYGRKVNDKDFEKLKAEKKFDVDGLYKDISDVLVYKNKLYVADQIFGRIDILTLDGKFIKSIKKVPAPTAIAIDPQTEDIYAVSKFIGKVFIYDKDGNFKGELLEPGDNIWALNFPNGIDFDSEGHIYIVDIASNGFKVYDKKGTFLYYMGAQKPSVYLGGFNNPKDLVIDDKDRIYVLDAPNKRVVIFQYLGELYKKGRRNMTVDEPMLRW
ncbi:hypothetical protein DEFDS_0750 [Deferribacter desulfuricans SSM1]|uniref:Uncharacterized protein n=1 Tax=Deferribacter desulfuricans (strain DSM 14783 / JCM 11476 / NBRC 101012 / SSM1) TaxID=639282 RepID=D3PCA6_DEFDS|nr:hypothetical protein [Deferribacter desulfuricans]BAI80229.1 hypothetical protein DEFDS_0750 [Deferribacter desulfuricans SSM1]